MTLHRKCHENDYYWATDCRYNTALSDKINSLKEGVYVLFSH